MVTARGFCYSAIPNKCSLLLMISCSLNFAARHQAGQEPSAFPCMHSALTNCWPGNNKLESFRETSLALRYVCTQTHEEIPHTQVVGGFAKRHHPLETMAGSQYGPFSWGSSFHSSSAHQAATQAHPSSCPTSHCIKPSPVQRALGPESLCCPPLPQGHHSPVLGLPTSQNWGVQTPRVRVLGPAHTPGTAPVHIAPLIWNKTPFWQEWK